MVQPYNGGCRIAASTTEAGSHRNAFSQLNVEPDRLPGSPQHFGGRAIDKVSLVCCQLRYIAPKANILTVHTQPDLYLVIEGDRLHDRPQIVESIGATIEDSQDQIDFGRSED